MTITSCKSISSTSIGLFGELWYRSYIDGVILEDLSTDASDYYDTEIIASPRVGGIAVFAQPQVIVYNSIVNGAIHGSGERNGGIIGENNCAIIGKSSFKGKINAINNNVIGVFSVG